MAHIHQKVVALISEEPSKRGDLEINLLLPWFKSMSDLFKSQKTDTVKDILRNCEFRSVPRDDVIIMQGARGDSFYIILSGAVSVYINQTLEEQGNLEDTPKLKTEPSVDVDCNGNEPGNNDVTTDSLIGAKEIDLKSISGKSIGLDRASFGVHIRLLGPGKSFGELALVQTNYVRNASIIADESTDLVVIDRELYNRSLKAAQKHEVQQKLDFVSSHELFSTWTRRQRAVLTMSLMRSRYQYGNVIIRQGNPADSLIFITKGQAKVTIDPTKLFQQYPSMCKDSDLAKKRLSRSDRKRNHKHQKRNSSPTNEDQQHKPVQQEICIVGQPDCIGEFEVLLRLPTYTQTVSSMEEVETLELDLTNFTRLIAKKRPATYRSMHYIAEMKLITRLKRLQLHQIHHPVLQHILQRFTEYNSSFQDSSQQASTDRDDDVSNDPLWYEYRDKQRRFLQHRQTARAARERHESRKHNTHFCYRPKDPPLLGTNNNRSNNHLLPPDPESDGESEILPVISHDTRININPASGLIKLPRSMYALDNPAPRSRRMSNAFMEGVEWQRSKIVDSIAVPTSSLPGSAITSVNRSKAKSPSS